jgi:hypothetical protein
MTYGPFLFLLLLLLLLLLSLYIYSYSIRSPGFPSMQGAPARLGVPGAGRRGRWSEYRAHAPSEGGSYVRTLYYHLCIRFTRIPYA